MQVAIIYSGLTRTGLELGSIQDLVRNSIYRHDLPACPYGISTGVHVFNALLATGAGCGVYIESINNEAACTI